MNTDESILYEDNEIYGGMFNEWRVKRVRKLEKVFGREWFINKKILELGCAFGNVGLYFKSLGADVTFSDARKEALEIVKQKDDSVELIQLNQEQAWLLDRKFDLILHFGLLYNLDNWFSDLLCTIHHTKYLALETAVARFSTNFECKIINTDYSHEYHGPFSGVGSLVSSANIECVFDKFDILYNRYDDVDLNLNEFEFCYNWTEQLAPIDNHTVTPIVHSWWSNPYIGGRRFWIAEVKNPVSIINLL